MHRSKSVAPWTKGALLLGLALLPHQVLLHSFFPLEFQGKNLWLILSLGFALAGMTLLVALEGGVWARRALLGSALLWVSGIWIGLYWPGVSVAEVVINTRPLFMLPAALLAGLIASRDARFQRQFLALVIAQGLLQAVIGVLHTQLFPHVVTGTFAYLRGVAFFVTDDWQMFTSREAGALGNPSAYAEMIGLGAFASCYYLAGQVQRLHTLRWGGIFMGLWLLFMAAVIPSLSRVALVFVSVPFLVLLPDRLGRAESTVRRHLLVVASIVLFAIVLVVALQYPQLLDRFRVEGMYGRTQKNALLLWTLTSNLEYFFHGLPSELLKSLRTPEGIGFGDNSYLRLVAATGVPLFCAWVALLTRIWQRGRQAGMDLASSLWLRVALLGYVLVLLYLGDVLFNDGWILMGIMLLASRMLKVAHVPAAPGAVCPTS